MAPKVKAFTPDPRPDSKHLMPDGAIGLPHFDRSERMPGDSKEVKDAPYLHSDLTDASCAPPVDHSWAPERVLIADRCGSSVKKCGELRLSRQKYRMAGLPVRRWNLRTP